jgi:hypothetical protein
MHRGCGSNLSFCTAGGVPTVALREADDPEDEERNQPPDRQTTKANQQNGGTAAGVPHIPAAQAAARGGNSAGR